MSPKASTWELVTSWTNGRKAVVELLRDGAGEHVIRKTYRTGYETRMFREYAVAEYVSRLASVSPRVLAFSPRKKQILFQYLPGIRVLEWVLSRFGDHLDLSEFHSFHGLMPPHNVDARVAEAFVRFRESNSIDVLQLKHALRDSYGKLHRLGIKHGSADPRNVLYHEGRIFIIDFDNSRPSLSPSATDDEDLKYWYGI